VLIWYLFVFILAILSLYNDLQRQFVLKPHPPQIYTPTAILRPLNQLFVIGSENKSQANQDFQAASEVLEVSPEVKRLLTFGNSTIKCPACNKGALVLVGVVYPSARGDPTTGIEHIIPKLQAV
jgi:hypothetical protein